MTRVYTDDDDDDDDDAEEDDEDADADDVYDDPHRFFKKARGPGGFRGKHRVMSGSRAHLSQSDEGVSALQFLYFSSYIVDPGSLSKHGNYCFS